MHVGESPRVFYTHVPTASLDQSFGYDNLDRLTQANSSTTGRTWGYDLTGNRTQGSVSGATDTYSTAATSNQLNTITGGVARTFSYDAMGNITGDGTFTATYDARGRLKTVTKAGSTTSYDYDGIGQRIKKSGGPAGTVFYVYDTDRKLLGEYNGSAVAVNEYVWLGDMPLAVLTSSETLRDDTAGGGTVNFLGTWTAGVTTAYGYYGSNYHTHAAQAASSETVTWNLSLAAGTYKVYARWPASTTHSAQALYQVIHASGTTNVTVNQKLDGGEWVLLGSFSMTSANSKVVLTPQPDGIVAADAVKAVDTSEASRIFFVHADHLNAPRAVMNSANQLRWRWTSDPFGLVSPEDNPAGLGVFTLNLRLPGQLYDIESNLHYNYFRDYDPSTGRYVESDPIGLRGGINTYGYALSNPVSFFDRDGRCWWCVVIPVAIGATWWALTHPPVPAAAPSPIQSNLTDEAEAAGSEAADELEGERACAPGAAPNSEECREILRQCSKRCVSKWLSSRFAGTDAPSWLNACKRSCADKFGCSSDFR